MTLRSQCSDQHRFDLESLPPCIDCERRARCAAERVACGSFRAYVSATIEPPAARGLDLEPLPAELLDEHEDELEPRARPRRARPSRYWSSSCARSARVRNANGAR
jgi:hypothetical protein